MFDGRQSTPYGPDAATAPLSVYGTTKRDGEVAAGPGALIVRTSWVYAAGGANFVATMPTISKFLIDHTPPFIGKVYRAAPKDLERNPAAKGSVSLWFPRPKVS